MLCFGQPILRKLLNELFSPKLSDFSPFDDNDRALLWRNDASIIRNLVWCEKNGHECQIIYAFSHALILVHHAQPTCIKGTVKKGGWVQSSYSSGFLGLTKCTQKEFCFCSICCYQKIMANFFIASDPGKYVLAKIFHVPRRIVKLNFVRQNV